MAVSVRMQRSPKGQTLKVLGRCLRYLGPYRLPAAASALATLCITAFSLAIPQLIRLAVDGGIGGRDPALLGRGVFSLLGLGLLKGVFSYLQGRWSETASQGVACDLRSAIHRKLTALSFSFHDRSETGEILSRAIQDVERIRFLTGRPLLRLLEGGVLLAGSAVLLVAMNPPLALMTLGFMPLIAYRGLVFGRRSKPLALALQKQLAALTTRVEQNLRGMRVVRAYAQEGSEIARFERENRRWLRLAERSARLNSVHLPLLNLIASLGVVSIVALGGAQVIQQRLSLGELVAFLTYLGQLFAPVRRLGAVIPSMAQASVAAARVLDILDSSSEVVEKPGALRPPAFQGRVRFESVSYAYFGRYRALRDVSFEVLQGQVVALLGPSGCGKTTLVHLIPRFYDVTGGRILIDGLDIRDLELAFLREHIGIVPQETTLFDATVRENIAFGRPGASSEKILAAARAAQAHEFIAALPRGYDTQVGERGVTLSGGQKQRLAMARALLKDPPLLILDDATSHVDADTEALIQQALDRLMEGRTCFVIAHRPSTVRRADKILVLERGALAACGSHQELLSSSGLYVEIYDRQLRLAEAMR